MCGCDIDTGASGGSAGPGGGVGGLEELDISENPLDSKGTHMLANRLIKDFHSLKMLNLEKCNIDCPRLLTAIEQASKKGVIISSTYLYLSIFLLVYLCIKYRLIEIGRT